MQMAGRIRRAWLLLAEQITADDPPFKVAATFQRWIRDHLAEVSKKAAAGMEKARGIILFLDRDPRTLPISLDAAREFQHAIGNRQPEIDPDAFVAFVDRLCWRFVVYRREDDGCPMDGDGDLELWTDGKRLIEVCDSFGHMFNESGQPITNDIEVMVPATLDDVRRRYESPSLAQ